MWVYKIKSGRLERKDVLVATGYSGFGEHKNNPLSTHLAGLGPIPEGAYLIGTEREVSSCGPVVLPLMVLTGTQTFGRGAPTTGPFEIHGDSIEHPGSASHGCIILDRKTRELISGSSDRLLVVLSGVI